MTANEALQRFEGIGKPGEAFAKGKGLVNHQTETAGAVDSTTPAADRRG